MSDRIFKVGRETMHGDDVKAWQDDVKRLFKDMGIDCPIKSDGDYGVATRGATASLCRAMGLESAGKAMEHGVTPELRIKLRNKKLTAVENNCFHSAERVEYRKDLRARWNTPVHAPTRGIITDDWGFHPPVHDGIDVVTRVEQPIFAMIKSKVIDVRSSGWWGKGAPSDPKLRAKGDGIIQVEVLESVGAFKKGDHIGYGHCEKACVREGQTVVAGQPLGMLGFANAWHIHLMLNDGKVGRNSDGNPLGVGNKDPRACLNYALKHG